MSAWYNDGMQDLDERFIVKILWTTRAMLDPFIQISLPENMDDRERIVMLDALAETASSRKGYTGHRHNKLVEIRGGVMHAWPPRKNGTPRPPAVIPWLIKESVRWGFLPREDQLRFDVSWLKPDAREPTLDTSTSTKR